MQITLIGAGFCGSTLAVELLRQGGPDTRVTLVGQPETFGRGVAYGAARPEHLLNVRAKDLGADAAVPSGFADTLALGERGRLDFLPRLAYGEYLQSRLQQAAEAASGLARIEEEAVAVDRVPGGFQVLLANGEDFFSEVVVLAVGALPPQRLAGVGPRLAVDRRYIGWPWQDGAIDTIAPEARLLIVGAGLTMADVAVTLRQRGHRGPITALSRHGLVPQAHLEVPGAPLELPPGVHQALRDHDLRGLVRTLRQLSTVVEDWRRVVDALRPHLQPFWRGLDLATRARFLRHLRSHWETLRHRLAPSVAGQLQAMQAAGQLRVVAGRLLRARVGGRCGSADPPTWRRQCLAGPFRRDDPRHRAGYRHRAQQPPAGGHAARCGPDRRRSAGPGCGCRCTPAVARSVRQPGHRPVLPRPLAARPAVGNHRRARVARRRPRPGQAPVVAAGRCWAGRRRRRR